MVLIQGKEVFTQKVNYSFRPLAGIMVLIYKDWEEDKKFLKEGFRPLAGIMVLIEEADTDDDAAGFLVSVPLRGLWFLSPGNRRIRRG